MTKTSNNANWQPLDSLRNIFSANLDALASRDVALADRLRALTPKPRHVRELHSALQIGIQSANTVHIQPNPVTPASAKEVTAKLCPSQTYVLPVLVAGIDQGWLWSSLYSLPANVPALPGHRPPLYFLVQDVERLWTAMHLHEWRGLLADNRTHLFVGPNATQQLRETLLANARLVWPRLSVTIEHSLWREGETLDTFLRSINSDIAARLQTLTHRNNTASAAMSAIEVARGLRSDRPLRVMGITSRYTTFLQHSMRDWLDAFSRLGHETHLVIERADHEVMNNVVYTQAVADFRPDLVVIIDHYRAELAAIPATIPCVMWVQDQLPNICSAKGGAAQADRDYCLGFGRLQLSRKFGYPADRYMPATVPVNESRFTPAPLTDEERSQYACDVSFVTHASTPADVLVKAEMKKIGGDAQRLIGDVFERLRAIYADGNSLTQPILLRRLIETSLLDTKTSVDAPSLAYLMDFFQQKVNNALFRHQSIEWLVEMDVNLRLYGNGWESHPTLARYARGPANNQTQLSAICRASKINLQATPHGAVHQRLFEGLAAGGFFLIRQCPGDLIERVYRKLYEWCMQHNVRSNEQIRSSTSPEVQQWLREAEHLIGVSPFDPDYNLCDNLELSHDGEFIRSAGAIWDDYDAVAFNSRDELQQRVTRYLNDTDARQSIACSMREKVLERFTYVSTTERLVDFIATDLERQATPLEAAA